MDYREVAIERMTRAFELWEIEYRKNPESFMDQAMMKQKTPGLIGELRALYFVELLEKLDNQKGGN